MNLLSKRLSLFFLAFLFFSQVILAQPQQAQNQFSSTLSITHLTKDYYIYETYKSFGGKPVSANSMYLVTTEGVVLFDTPWDSTQFQPLLDSIKKRHNKTVFLCIATHSHEDRTAGLEYYRNKNIKTFTSFLTDSISVAHNEKRAEFHFSKDTVFTVGQYSFQTYYGGEGHTKDNVVLWFPNEKILYGGCFIKSTEAADLGYIKEANLKAWPMSLKNVMKKFPAPKFVIAGHQDWRNPKCLEHTLKLLKRKGS